MGNQKLMAVALFFIILSLFISISPYVPQLPHPVKQTSSFQLNLGIALRTQDNVTDYAFYVLVGGVDQSSAAINVPSNVSVRITVFNQDPGIDKLLKSSDANLSGSDTGIMNVKQYTNSSFPISDSEVFLPSARGVSFIAPSNISHTFTTSNGLNIPIPPDSAVMTNVTFTQPGVYSWGCMCECGPFSMETPGWMYGTFVVS
ncbi:hypothetical protein IX51_10355 [uncultured archaeon]|nr:hypothetical protein IX51_10355 [uncultured archaeon]